MPNHTDTLTRPWSGFTEDTVLRERNGHRTRYTEALTNADRYPEPEATHWREQASREWALMEQANADLARRDARRDHPVPSPAAREV